MKALQRYKITILILSLVVIIQGVFIIILARPKKVPRIPVGIKGKIAIVLDDWGYNLNHLSILETIKYPLTISVLPNLAYSKIIARELHQRGFEVILHLPLEPQELLRLEENTIMTSFDESTIRDIMRKDLSNLSSAVGVSNHMGSKATEDIKTMQSIFKELKKRRLYFLDSLVSSESVSCDLAYKMQIGFAKRDIFLDNEENPEYVKGQLHKLKLRAQIQGSAIGIGHDKKNTLEVLKEVMPQIEKEGYQFAFVSELIK